MCGITVSDETNMYLSTSFEILVNCLKKYHYKQALLVMITYRRIQYANIPFITKVCRHVTESMLRNPSREVDSRSFDQGVPRFLWDLVVPYRIHSMLPLDHILELHKFNIDFHTLFF